ncbi:hypothetical protein Dde_2169 [Oleidesulfovibrio alaskensis G20]|jgi:uncharacterized protein YdcH (DUF465 family)|uniref:DUF465 domain-containing protein n=1 Tax=Oleidesulfovibrio alaskensis (strain ATCC BAA-1058 / DSM 17464 / G20) TaxID=207559 RepID=Q30ZD0_OLEA2|nr:DUF465 domain-containing protein [Oleidesulfovibrio alaskensis]ABB38966.2 hypothetical protein Dde_2169 [Oleidesulfovibrio alaskensis G20]MBG0772251.1 DUF465 domain-containing protein [Oleidesulfovibrio alaskensis]MBL3583320.1 DUF465 domain-containing protein [Oleidesulfovibrio alaskensis]
METRDLELLEKLSSRDPELKALWEDHVLYEKQIEKLDNKPFLTPSEQTHVKELKKQKLEGKTKLLTILESYRSKEN